MTDPAAFQTRSVLFGKWKGGKGVGALFNGWKQLEGHDLMWKWRETYEPMIVWLPRTWLLSEGWRRHGLIPCTELPSSGAASHAR